VSGYLRIGGAALSGILIILGALYVQNNKETSANVVTGSIVTTAPDRQHIPTTDADSDGVEDWKAGITDSVFASIETPTTTLALKNSESYTPPTTFTGKFAEAFFTDYMEGKVSGDDFQNKDQLIGNALGAIEKSTQSKVYTAKDIVSVSDSMENMREYGNRIAEIILAYSIKNENEAVILKRALDTNDKTVLKELAPVRTVYEKILEDSLLVPTPRSMITSHLALLTAYEAVKSDIEAMEQVFNDPLLTLARIKRYEDDATGLYLSLKKVASMLITGGVTYANDEPGALIYTLNI